MPRLAASLLLLLFAASPALAQATFHGNPARTGVYDGPGPSTLRGVKWAFHTDGAIVTSPVVAGGVVYIAGMDGYLHAVNEATGEEKWKFKSSRPIASSVAVDAGSVYFVSSAGALAALDAETGDPRWVFAVEYERKFEAKNLHGYPSPAQTIPDAWDLFTSSPALVEGTVYFGAGDGGVYAVDAATGVLQWKFQTGGVVHASPAVAGGMVYIGSWDSRLYAIEAATGRLVWSFQAGLDPAVHNQEGFQSSPAVVDGVVYVGCRDAHVYALDAATGAKKWDYPTSKSWVIGTPAVNDGVVYAGTSDSARFMALDAATGRLLFNFDAKAYVFSSGAIAGGLVYFGSHNGRLYAVDAKTGNLAWQFQTDASRENRLGVLNDDGSLNRDGFTPLFGDFEDMYVDFYRFASIGAIMSSPAVHDGVLFVGSMDGTLYALH